MSIIEDEHKWAARELARYTPPERQRLLQFLLLEVRELVAEVTRQTGAGMALARRALEERDMDVPCAVEWIVRKDLACVMPEGARFPLWTAKKKGT